jgi:hypothetical protein
MLRRDLGDRRGLADAGRADEDLDRCRRFLAGGQRREAGGQRVAQVHERRATAARRRHGRRDLGGNLLVETGGAQPRQDRVLVARHRLQVTFRLPLRPGFRHLAVCRGGHLDQSLPHPAAPAGAVDHPSAQHNRVGTEVLANARQRLLQRLRAVLLQKHGLVEHGDWRDGYMGRNLVSREHANMGQRLRHEPPQVRTQRR